MLTDRNTANFNFGISTLFDFFNSSVHEILPSNRIMIFAAGILMLGGGYFVARRYLRHRNFKKLLNTPKPFSISFGHSNEASNKLLIRFYRGEGRDSEGRFLGEILAWDDHRLESQHDYIQWLFPSTVLSAFNSNAPLLDKELIDKMKHDELVIANLKNAFARMMVFYGFSYDGTNRTVTMTKTIGEMKDKWLHPGDHNFLRITRILTCLVSLGLRPEAEAFFEKLSQIHEQYPELCGNSYSHWAGAVFAEQ